MNDLHAIRRANLRRLINEKYGGVQARFAGAVHKKAAYIYQLLTEGPHAKNIGEQVAREIEELAGLPAGSLDQSTSQSKPIAQRGQSIDASAAAPIAGGEVFPVAVFDLSSLRALKAGESPPARERIALVYSARNSDPLIFSIDVFDNSMAPNLLQGERVLIHPGLAPEPGDIVLARVLGEPLIRRYQVDGLRGQTAFKLSAINNGYSELSSVTKEIEILGTLVESHKYRGSRMSYRH